MVTVTLAVLLAAPLPPEMKGKTETVLVGAVVVADKVYLNVGSQLEPEFVILKFVDWEKFSIVAAADCRRAEMVGRWSASGFWVDRVVLYSDKVPWPISRENR